MNNRQQYIQSVINELSVDEKALLEECKEEQSHEYIHFDISVFNAGMVVSISETDDFDDELIEDGYSFYLPQSELDLFDLT